MNSKMHSAFLSSRRLMGRELAKEAPLDVDTVIAVPDSGTTAAIGYAEESGRRSHPTHRIQKPLHNRPLQFSPDTGDDFHRDPALHIICSPS